MKADGVRVAIRPRGILECLDLAVMFCGRRPLPVAAATAIGAAPFILLNRILAAMLGPEEMPPLAAILAVEAAWASVPLTLYLGQSVFAERFSLRAALRDVVAALPALLVFQGLLRTVCLAVCVLAPVVFVGMYYLDQIILLERPPFAGVWSRRTAINRGRVAGVMRLACIDGLLLAGGTVLGTRLLAAIASLWRGRGVSWGLLGGEDLLTAVFSWHGQIAFWATCSFLTVFRFFTYLDGRIRREGWDVELRLRADDTYAGLAANGGRRPTTPLTLVVLLAVAITAAAARGAAPAPEAEDVARRALSRQSFPWYDSASDRFRPLIAPDDDAAATRDEAATSGDGDGSSARGGRRGPRIPLPRLSASPFSPELLAVIARGLMISLLVAAVAAVVWLLVRYGLRDGEPRQENSADDPAASTDEPDPIAALPASLRLGAADLLARAESAANLGDFAAAALHLHAWLLVELGRRGALVLARGKTNGQYRAEVAAALPAAAGVFGDSSRLFEDVFFGRLPVDRDAFLAVWSRRVLLNPPGPPAEVVP
ncbi:MAG: DUF4129 domain-containing protein [Planctomycetaceae bacterium]